MNEHRLYIRVIKPEPPLENVRQKIESILSKKGKGLKILSK